MPPTDPADIDFTALMALESHGPDVYVGISPDYPWGRVYGGQVVAQGLRAAAATVDDDRHVHSLHAYFIRGGTSSEPIRYEVDRIRNGRSFTTRRVVARQSEGAILNLSCSFQVVEDQANVQESTAPDHMGTAEDGESEGWGLMGYRRVIQETGHSASWLRPSEPCQRRRGASWPQRWRPPAGTSPRPTTAASTSTLKRVTR